MVVTREAEPADNFNLILRQSILVVYKSFEFKNEFIKRVLNEFSDARVEKKNYLTGDVVIRSKYFWFRFAKNETGYATERGRRFNTIIYEDGVEHNDLIDRFAIHQTIEDLDIEDVLAKDDELVPWEWNVEV